MTNPIRPYAIELILSHAILEQTRKRAERKRKRQGEQHLVTVYLALNDPHSYLLLQVLAQFQARFGVQYDFRTVLNRQDEMFPAPQLWDKNAFQDGVWLAGLYGLNFPAESPQYTAERTAQLTAQLLHWELQPGYLPNALALFAAYWHGDSSALAQLTSPTIVDRPECYQHHLAANETLLKDNGHYLSGMLHYSGE